MPALECGDIAPDANKAVQPTTEKASNLYPKGLRNLSKYQTEKSTKYQSPPRLVELTNEQETAQLGLQLVANNAYR